MLKKQMEISAKHLSQTKVLDSQGKLICHLNQAIINPENGQIMAFIINTRTYFGNPPANIISLHDIIKWEKYTLTLGQNYEFHQASELVRIDHLLKSPKSHLLGKKVRTQNGQYLGQVSDFSLNQNHRVLSSITCHKKFLNLIPERSHIIHQKNILEIKSREIIVKDSTVKLPITNLVRSTPDKFSLQSSPTFDRA